MHIKKQLDGLVDQLTNRSLIVVGDIMVDKYIRGEVSRISPEAPVPVVKITREQLMPGGAGNVVNNLAEFSTQVYVGGVVGADYYGEKLVAMLEKEGGDSRAIIRESSRITTVKTRVIAVHQQVVRTDREKIGEISPQAAKKILNELKNIEQPPAGIIISDYGKGVVTRQVIKDLIKYAGRFNIPVVVDPQIGHFFEYKNVTAITPNQKEAGAALGRKIETEKEVIQAAEELLNRLNCDVVLITRGSKGMVLAQKDKKEQIIPTAAREVFDVSGAGDTVTGIFTLALSSGVKAMEAALMANYAAAVVVGKLGTATVKPRELKDKLGKK